MSRIDLSALISSKNRFPILGVLDGISNYSRLFMEYPPFYVCAD